MVTIAY